MPKIPKKPKPITPSPLSDPKKWKWCKHEVCLEETKKLDGFGSGGNEGQKLMWKIPRLCAVFLEDYCWEHLSEETKANYKTKIEEWVRQRRSLEGANLWRVKLRQAELQEADLRLANLQKVDLQEADLKKASLYGINLEGANLEEAKLQEADLNQAELQNANLVAAKLQEAKLYLANLQNADLGEAELQNAFLREAKLQKTLLGRTNFQNADLSDAKLQEAYLGGTNFQEADLDGAELNGAFLYAVELDGAKRLTWKQLQKREDREWVGKARVGEEKEKSWAGASDAYRRLKNYFHQQGRYADEVKAYYREKLMAKHEAFWQCFKGHQPNLKPRKGLWKRFFPHLWNKITDFFRWFWLWVFWGLTGFGERPQRTITAAFLTVVAFGCLYWLGASIFHLNFPQWLNPQNPLYYFYFSIVTFATLGFGDISPACPQTAVLVTLEVIFGYVFLGLIITIIARKFGR